MALPAAVVDGHLAPLAQVVRVAVALGHKLFQGVVSIHQHTCEGGRRQLVGVGVLGGKPFLPRPPFPSVQ